MATDVITPDVTSIGPEEYLAGERDAQSKHEWIDGEVREMTGASRAHNLIVAALLRIFGNQLVSKPFELYPSDMRVRVPDGPYYYPDVTVAPDPPALEDEHHDTLLNPLVIFEVLSPSTEAIDRGEKLDNYGRIPSLTDYLLVSQDRVRVDHCRREGEGVWRVTIITDPQARLALEGIGCELPLTEIYDRVLPAAS
jgi:Uma2 family endonuclease